MSLEGRPEVISMLVAGDEERSVLTATENGFGKRTPIGEYTRHGRGTKGMIAIRRASATARWSAPCSSSRTTRSADHHRRRARAHAVSEIREMGRARRA